MTTATSLSMTAEEYFRAKLEYEETPHGLAAALEKGAGSVLVLDVRDGDSYKTEHIAGAKNVPLQELGKRLRELPKDKTVVTYCWNITCALAPKAALALAQQGYRVKELSGGLADWKAKGFKTEGTAAKA